MRLVRSSQILVMKHQAKTKEFKVYLNDNKASLNHILPQAYAAQLERLLSAF